VTQENRLSEYVQAPDPAFQWDILTQRAIEGGTLYDILLCSQKWQQNVWRHRLHLFVPQQAAAPEWGMLTIGSDYPESEEILIDTALACRLGLVSAHLFDIPNQPLFDGMREDALMAYTLSQCHDTGDWTWPLLFPMVKAAVRALDIVQAICADRCGGSPGRHLLHGASKRGWTSWLTAVVDSRVGAIIPEVYDNLNLFAQMPHQVAMWHNYSEMIDDFTEHNLQEKMRTPMGWQIATAIDPYSYRAGLTLPKLLINSLNDRYWATDALNLYWNDLSGGKHVVYAPNESHKIDDRRGVDATKSAFIGAVLGGVCLPEVAAEYAEGPAEFSIAVRSDTPAVEGRLWVAASARQDFRDCCWSWTPLTASDGGRTFTGALTRPASGYVAVMAECIFPGKSGDYGLSTPVRILSSAA